MAAVFAVAMGPSGKSRFSILVDKLLTCTYKNLHRLNYQMNVISHLHPLEHDGLVLLVVQDPDVLARAEHAQALPGIP